MSYINIALSQAKTRRVWYAPGFIDSKIGLLNPKIIEWHRCNKFSDEPIPSLVLDEPGEYRVTVFTLGFVGNPIVDCYGSGSKYLSSDDPAPPPTVDWHKHTWSITALMPQHDEFDFFIHVRTDTDQIESCSCTGLVLIYELIT